MSTRRSVIHAAIYGGRNKTPRSTRHDSLVVISRRRTMGCEEPTADQVRAGSTDSRHLRYLHGPVYSAWRTGTLYNLPGSCRWPCIQPQIIDRCRALPSITGAPHSSKKTSYQHCREVNLTRPASLQQPPSTAGHLYIPFDYTTDVGDGGRGRFAPEMKVF